MKRMTAVVLSILLLNIFVFGANAEEHIKAEREKEDWTIVNKKDTKRERLRRNHLLKRCV